MIFRIRNRTTEGLRRAITAEAAMFSIRDEVTACASRLEERLRQARNDSADGSSSPTAPGHRGIADRALDGVLFFRCLGAHPTAVGCVSTWKEPHDRSGRIRLDWARGASDEIHWTYRRLVMLGEREGFETDAGLLHRRRDAEGRVIRMAAIGGTYLRPYEMEPLPAPGILVWSATK